MQRATSAPNAFNEEIQTWADFITVWAARRDASDRERFAAGQLGAGLVSRFIIRSSTQARTISPQDRIFYEGAIWNITGVKETPDGRLRFLEITAVRDIG